MSGAHTRKLRTLLSDDGLIVGWSTFCRRVYQETSEWIDSLEIDIFFGALPREGRLRCIGRLRAVDRFAMSFAVLGAVAAAVKASLSTSPRPAEHRSTAFKPPTAAEAAATIAAAEAEKKRLDGGAQNSPFPGALTVSVGNRVMIPAVAETGSADASVTLQNKPRTVLGSEADVAGEEAEAGVEYDEGEEAWEDLAEEEPVLLPGKELVKRMSNVRCAS